MHGGNSINQSCPRILKSLVEEKTRDYEKSPNLDALSEQEPSKQAEQVCQAQARWSWWGAAGQQRWCYGQQFSIINLDSTRSSEWCCPRTFLRGSDWEPKNEKSVLPGALRREAAAVGPASTQCSVTILRNEQTLMQTDQVLFIACTS